MTKIAIVTPLKNEESNIPRLFQSVLCQEQSVFHWVIVENGSTDRSKELLNDSIKDLSEENICIHLIHFGTEHEEYALGTKYASVVSFGFSYIRSNNLEFDFIGILDADCFPAADYYKRLLRGFERYDNIGLLSGRLVKHDGKLGNSSKRHVRGSGRLWRKEAWKYENYVISVSADSNSRILTILEGWKIGVVQKAFYVSREASSVVGYEYYGKSAYYNNFSYLFIIIKLLKLILTNPTNAKLFLAGFVSAKHSNIGKIENNSLIKYNKKRVINKFLHRKYATII